MRRRFARGRIKLSLAALIALATGEAYAGAWTEPAGQGQMIASLYGWQGNGAPWGGSASGQRESKAEAQVYLDYGAFDRLTLFGQAGGEDYRLGSPGADAYGGLDYTTLGARYQVFKNDPFVFSLEASALIPGARDASRPAQMGNTGAGADARALAGYSFTIDGLPAFLDAEFGYRFRTLGPPSEWHGDLTLGIKPTARLMLLAQCFNTLSVGAGAPNFPDWDQSVVEISAVYALDEVWSLQAGAFASVVAHNTNGELGVTVAVWRKF
jgi:hypothetical protein